MSSNRITVDGSRRTTVAGDVRIWEAAIVSDPNRFAPTYKEAAFAPTYKEAAFVPTYKA